MRLQSPAGETVFFEGIRIRTKIEQIILFPIKTELYSAVCENKTTGISRSFLRVLRINISTRI